MTFKTHYEPVPVPVIEAGEVIYQIEGDDLQSIYLRPRPDTVLLTREEVERIRRDAYLTGHSDGKHGCKSLY